MGWREVPARAHLEYGLRPLLVTIEAYTRPGHFLVRDNTGMTFEAPRERLTFLKGPKTNVWDGLDND